MAPENGVDSSTNDKTAVEMNPPNDLDSQAKENVLDPTEARTIIEKPADSTSVDKAPEIIEPEAGASDDDEQYYSKEPICEGMKIGGFVLTRSLGKGGMGEVWLASQDLMNREVALKLLNANDFVNDPEFVDRFMNEIENTGKMHHPNIITAFDAGRQGNLVFMATEYIEGEDMRKILERDGKISEERSLKIVRDIADALRYAWNTFNIIHRDIKPGNIMIDKDGSPRMMDMGLAKSLVNEAHNLTMTGVVLGTPYYMSPEQAMAKKDIDYHMDIYSLGTTLYHLVTGEIPFKGKTLMEIIEKVVNKPMIPAVERNSQVTPHCSALIEKMTAKKPADRHGSWEEVIRDIELVMKGQAPRVATSSTSGDDSSAEKPSNDSKGDAPDTNLQDASQKDSNLLIPIIFAATVVIVIILVIVYLMTK